MRGEARLFTSITLRRCFEGCRSTTFALHHAMKRLSHHGHGWRTDGLTWWPRRGSGGHWNQLQITHALRMSPTTPAAQRSHLAAFLPACIQCSLITVLSAEETVQYTVMGCHKAAYSRMAVSPLVWLSPPRTIMYQHTNELPPMPHVQVARGPFARRPTGLRDW